jgi:hypothetical protein
MAKKLTLEQARKLLFVQPEPERSPAEEGEKLGRKAAAKMARELKKAIKNQEVRIKAIQRAQRRTAKSKQVFKKKWQKVVFAADLSYCPDCDEEWCTKHHMHYADCPCIGPTEENVDYKLVKGVLYGRRTCPNR